MRLILIILLLLNVFIQYPLWFGKDGWLHARQLQQKIVNQQEINAALLARNNALTAEVIDLETGTQAIEETARNQRGMIKQDEFFIHTNNDKQ